ncbi:MAG: chromosomal replication initiator protein DnaA [Treponema sp.]|uniref:chromosomal replication initiator protein DnaA n=1 Tax=Treponema sp. TaxID=166 RepID=UPI0025E2C88F|nr:chromosomal replication initiator protein DnaA [Treponema sp.]MBQ9281464.1 chromosomal replication initiator protein DnaA [Treponema sp.]
MSEQNYKDFFEEAMNQIHEELKSSGNENEFILNFKFSYIEDTLSEIKVSVPSKFLWDRMVQKGNVQKVQSKINELTGQEISLSPVFNSKPAEPSNSLIETSNAQISDSKNSIFVESSKKFESIPSQNLKNSDSSIEKHPQLIEEFTFENFVPNGEHDYAFNACLAAAKTPGNKNFNPILLYGPSGIGKTHLMVAIGNYIYSNNPKLKISYITTESLMNEFTASIRERSTDKFTKKYRKLDVLLLDDIQFLEKSEKLQDELFYTFDEIYNRKGQIVFTSDRPLKEINGIVERLKTRFSRGQNIDLKVPDYETRLAIIDKKLEIQGKSIPHDVKELIAKTFQSNVRELEGALSKMIGYAELMHKELTLDIAKEQLSDSIGSNESGIITVETIQKVVSDYYNISVSELKSESRKKTLAVPRHIAIYLSRQLTEYSLTEIGEEFGGRDHTTVMNSISKIENQLKIDSMIVDTLKVLEKQIKEYK